MQTEKLRFHGPLKIIYISDEIAYVRRSYPNNFEEAYDMLKRAADEGSGDAAASIAHMYLNGTIECADYKKQASEWSDRAIQSKSPYGFWTKAWVEMELRCPESAIENFSQSLELNFPAAAQDLGQVFQMGWGVDKDMQRSMEYFAKARDLGHFNAAWSINNLKISGEFGALLAITSGLARPIVKLVLHLRMLSGRGLSKHMLFYSFSDRMNQLYRR